MKKLNNRLEFDLDWRDSKNVDVFQLVGLYQWVMPTEGGFYWFVGAGAGLSSFDAGDNDGVFALIAGDIGIEYDFDFPLILSLDVRPVLGFNDSYSDDLDLDISLGIRYQFWIYITHDFIKKIMCLKVKSNDFSKNDGIHREF